MRPKASEKPTFIDLFAGIGGIRIAFEQSGAECVMSCEWDKWARQTYEYYFKDTDHPFHEDIRDIDLQELPEFDILTGGFPCQPFSIAGVSKKQSLGREHGFKDKTQGTLFFNVAEILDAAKPRSFLLENVRNLLSHDKGKTWQVIKETLRELGYAITYQVLDARTVVPQHRQRIFIIGFRTSFCGLSPHATLDWSPFWDAVEEELKDSRAEFAKRFDNPHWPHVGAILQSHEEAGERYVLSDKMWNYLQDYKAKHLARGNGFGFGLVDESSPYTRTISARYYKDGSEALVSRGDGLNPRRLTPRECARLQGFPDDFEAMYADRETQPVSDTQAYKQFGNSVCVPVVRAIAAVMTKYLQGPELFAKIRETGQLNLKISSPAPSVL